MRGSRFFVLATFSAIGVFLNAGSASAHDLRAKVMVAEAVKVEAYFSDDIPAESAEVTVTDEAGAAVHTGKTDERGVWTCPRPAPGTYTLTVKSVGHVAKVQFPVAGEPETPVVYTRWRMNKALGLAIGLALLLGTSAICWFFRRRRRVE